MCSPRLKNLLGFVSFLTLLVLRPPHIEAQISPSPEAWPLLAGTGQGLYGVNRYGAVLPLWTGGGVRKILRGGGGWFLLSDSGIFASPDLLRWEDRGQGLPVKTIKHYEGGQKSFVRVIQEIKDLEINPDDAGCMVCATKDTVFLSRDGGRSWVSLGMPPYRTNGIKAVAAANLPELTVFVSHSTYGVYYMHPDRASPRWTELNDGLEKLETTGNSDEVSDIAAAPGLGGTGPVIYAAQTFRRRLYQLDWEMKRFEPIWGDPSPFGGLDSIDIGPGTLRFIREGGIIEMNRPLPGQRPSPAALPVLSWERGDIQELLRLPEGPGMKPSCLVVRENGLHPGSELITLSELWLLDEETPPAGTDRAGGAADSTGAGSIAADREGLYLPVNHALSAQTLQPYLDIMAERNLNMVVIDMKDDYGRLRFSPENPGIAEKGRVFRPVDIDEFLGTMKSRGIYTAARVVVFKDSELARKEGERFALWDDRTNKAWVGYYDRRRLKQEPGAEGGTPPPGGEEILPADDPRYEIVRTYYDERWVDPYSEEVWDYIAEIARELHRRGFDEIQFDYIRFPTDGDNLGDIRCRWREQGMDMESAILSFLRHVRSRLEAPISIDIYGANGWYRTGARTGQEVELMAPYVDIICPMYYPSHFEQDFLAQAPAELRPYRIYYLGTQRTRRIARGQVIVRPYVQAFFLNVAYDRTYYDEAYVRRETEGVRAAGNGGLTYWNNSGRYDDIPLFPKE